MRPPRLRPPRADAASINAVMTPMIDVVFLLLVFFLCSSSFVETEGRLAASLAVAAPSAPGGGEPLNAEPPLEEVRLVGELAGEQVRWSLNGGPPTADAARLASLLREVAAIDPNVPVTIDCQPEAPFAAAVGAYDAARAAGFGRVLLSADPLGEGRDR